MRQKTIKFFRKLWLYMGINAGFLYVSFIPVFGFLYSLPIVKLNVPKENLTKCFYFSITTITTLGLGDIYPTNRMGQILVSAECFLGVLLIGMYLNALAIRANLKAKHLTSDELEKWIAKNKKWKDTDPDLPI